MTHRRLLITAVLIVCVAAVFAFLALAPLRKPASTPPPLSAAARFAQRTAPILARSTVPVPPITASVTGVLPRALSFLVPADAIHLRTNVLTYGTGQAGFSASFDASHPSHRSFCRSPSALRRQARGSHSRAHTMMSLVSSTRRAGTTRRTWNSPSSARV